MKISTFIFFLLVISGFFFIFGLMSQEGANLYPSANINDSEWRNQYDYVDEVNETIAPMQTAFEDIQDENKGWFSKVVSGIAAVPAAVVAIPTLVLGSFTSFGSLVSGLFLTLKVPPYLLLLVLVMVIVWGVFKLIEVYQRWQI